MIMIKSTSLRPAVAGLRLGREAIPITPLLQLSIASVPFTIHLSLFTRRNAPHGASSPPSQSSSDMPAVAARKPMPGWPLATKCPTSS